MKTLANQFQRVLAALQQHGFLLESDPKLPSVCTLITGEPLRSSWWAHPLAQTIFQVNEQLEDHPDVLITKLISGKVTYVHRLLWPDLCAIGSGRGDWQLEGLPPAACTLLATVDEQGLVRTDNLSWAKSIKTKPGDAARELEKRLLIVTNQVHTESGAHAKVLESWQHWAKRIGLKARKTSAQRAMKSLEERLERLNRQLGAKAKLPWT